MTSHTSGCHKSMLTCMLVFVCVVEGGCGNDPRKLNVRFWSSTISTLNLNQPSFSHPLFHTLSYKTPMISHILTNPPFPSSFLTTPTLPIPSLKSLPKHMVGNQQIHQSHHQTLRKDILGREYLYWCHVSIVQVLYNWWDILNIQSHFLKTIHVTFRFTRSLGK